MQHFKVLDYLCRSPKSTACSVWVFSLVVGQFGFVAPGLSPAQPPNADPALRGRGHAKLSHNRRLATRVICKTRALPGTVIPAKAGIYSASHWKCTADRVDSRFRGNDQCFELDPIPNDTSTAACEQRPTKQKALYTEDEGLPG